jgi:hypothetical protein
LRRREIALRGDVLELRGHAVERVDDGGIEMRAPARADEVDRVGV